MAPLQKFIFLSQDKIKRNEKWWMGEGVNGESEKNEECETPKQPKYGFIYFLELKNHINFPQESHVAIIIHYNQNG